MRTQLFPVILLLAACNGGGGGDKSYMMSPGEAADYEMTALREDPSPKPPPVSEEITKKVIRTGGIEFQSEHIEEDYRRIGALLPQYKAYIENENQSKSSHRINYTLTIRVPALGYDSLYNAISNMAYRLDHRYSNIDDVTERYYDLKTRIRNKEALEQRYIELLKKATAITDLLEIERNLNQVRTEIESLQGQFNYLSKQVDLSTINVSFYEVLPYAYDPSQRKGFGARVLSALDKGWQGFLSFLVVITMLWPFVFMVVGGLFIFTIVRRRWKRKK